MLNTCGKCALYLPAQKTCQIMPAFQGKMEPTDFCSKFKNFLYICDVCHQGTLNPTFEVLEDKIITLCENCR